MKIALGFVQIMTNLAFAADVPATVVTSGVDEVVLKAVKNFKGGRLVICNSANKVIASHPMKKRKLKIDFSNAGFGEYTIKLVKGDRQQLVRFFKR